MWEVWKKLAPTYRWQGWMLLLGGVPGYSGDTTQLQRPRPSQSSVAGPPTATWAPRLSRGPPRSCCWCWCPWLSAALWDFVWLVNRSRDTARWLWNCSDGGEKSGEQVRRCTHDTHPSCAWCIDVKANPFLRSVLFLSAFLLSVSNVLLDELYCKEMPRHYLPESSSKPSTITQ